MERDAGCIEIRPIDADGIMSAEDVMGGVSMQAARNNAMAAANAAPVVRRTRMSMTPE
jgi:hypothetical protein